MSVSQNPIVPISQPPTFVLPEDHANIIASTPSSFSDIPPVLRHKQENVSIELAPPVEGLSPEELSNGTLYIVDSVLAFISSSSGRGFQVLYPSITIHAVSRSGPSPVVYCQLEELSQAPQTNENGEEEINTVELNIKPADATTLDTIFESLSLCASLHPDPAMDDDDFNDDEAFLNGSDADTFEVFTGTEEEELSEVGRAALAHLESIIVYPPGHPLAQEAEGAYDDAEEEGESKGKEDAPAGTKSS